MTFVVDPSEPPNSAFALCVMILISLIALVGSEWLARRAGVRLHGG